jgi:hypothetical protein
LIAATALSIIVMAILSAGIWAAALVLRHIIRILREGLTHPVDEGD